jgi:hypothetical protein
MSRRMVVILVGLLGLLAIAAWLSGITRSRQVHTGSGPGDEFGEGISAPTGPLGPPPPAHAPPNPMIGEWASDGENSGCPSAISASESAIVVTLPNGAKSIQSVSYIVLDAANAIVLLRTGEVAERKTASVINGHLQYKDCAFHRPL